ncbi:MAG: orotidine-5'-phosphate decarboxylase [Clostridiales bacterium]|jgi:orotidine-5'-phosphate decarboxylase|nr:orotidine-5'-phosphate decarboxylase [Clostridiales bacterium]
MLAIQAKGNPSICGLDPFPALFPPHILNNRSADALDRDATAEAIIAFNKGIIDAVSDIVPAVKPQCAFYEQYGWQGVRALEETVKYAKNKGIFVLIDGKRNDIGSTAEGYARAYLGDTFDADALTVNGYLGTDGIKPFLSTKRMIFVLAKTSNPSSGELQDLRLNSGQTVSEKMAELCEQWGAETPHCGNYSNVGMVVGATYPKELADLREKAPHTFILVPGYGAQGGGAADIAAAFDSNDEGAIVNSSRGILYAYKKDGSRPSEDFASAARDAAIEMKTAIADALNSRKTR